MTIEDLKKVNLSASHPPLGMTDSIWQDHFQLLKEAVTPCGENKMPARNVPIIVNGRNVDYQFSYHGEPQWRRYSWFINDILEVIRGGKPDYCFYIYHVADLLKFEHERLRTKWLVKDQCFKVWLA